MRSLNALIAFLLSIILVLLPVVYIKRSFSNNNKKVALPVLLYARSESRLYQLDLEDYLTGVVAAEMPAEFSTEALKAQAIAARTIAVCRLKRFGGSGSRYMRKADFSDDPGESQAWLSVESMKRKWGYWNFLKYYQKINKAVRDTDGIIMTYRGRPIDAVFHSTCGVGTASAVEVWHNEVPYLKHESCGYDRASPHYKTYAFFTWDDLNRRFQVPKNTRRIQQGETYPDGRVKWLALGNLKIAGDKFRQKLALPSACFVWETTKTGLKFTIYGYGHGVGMCQYGANGMAKSGFNYQGILKHYYRGIEFRKLKSRLK